MISIWLLVLLVGQYAAMEKPHTLPPSIGSPVRSDRAGFRGEDPPHLSLHAADTIDIELDEGSSSIAVQRPGETATDFYGRLSEQQKQYGAATRSKDFVVPGNQVQQSTRFPMAIAIHEDRALTRSRGDVDANCCAILITLGILIFLGIILLVLHYGFHVPFDSGDGGYYGGYRGSSGRRGGKYGL
ncbi:hypothetical protein PGTUg99_008526 [Puccinia graminis f. sp. tritici]|uniref:Uncharacterized protein n=1 Tax=Puccinia graminis f. sp. tritici TaxID=56615 RepID=A0A5B0S4Q9_PUCGR|nr:hypothetical protein PGTUg99_008526 [Puccinia graminis f. sp. tritici]